ncbi:MAG: RHS repeat-associated core domain-containing protein, partial [Sphingobacteriales bacterium]
SIDYEYNIRGWLTKINDPDSLGTHLFAFKIGYDNPGASGTPLFNGNISATYWKSAADNIKRKYSYGYDHLNRLLNAQYIKIADNVNEVVTNSYNEALSYDDRGNITALQRNGYLDADDGTTITIDDLTYRYDDYSNRLLRVSDATNCPAGFNDQNTEGDDYTYDLYGNLKSDANKEIASIKYNHLNLPTLISFDNGSNIAYLYDSSGVKLKKIVTDGTTITRTQYLEGFQYKDNVLSFFPTSEGYVKVTDDSFNYIYNYVDHLGNIRLSYTYDQENENLKILEENEYYPFGLKHENYNVSKFDFKEENEEIKIKPVDLMGYKYKYNGKELQDEMGLNMYDYVARNYDPAIGRWMNMDPLAEKSRRFSPYTYALDNPVYYIDPDGMSATDWFKDKKGTMQFDPNVKSQKDLGKKGTYVGATSKQITSSGGQAYFRKDGSIMYSHEKDAYTRVMSNTLATKREQNAIIGEKSVLVLPDYNNSPSGGSAGKEFGYSYKGGNLQDPVTGKEFKTLASIHAHLNGSSPSTYTGESWGDLSMARNGIPNKPVYVMQNESGTDGLSAIVASPNTAGEKANYQVLDLTESLPNLNAESIQKNQSLRSFTESIDWIKMLKH